TAAMRYAAAIPGQPRICVDITIWLGRDEVEATDVGIGDCDGAPKPTGPEPVRVLADADVAAALPAFGLGTYLHDLSTRSDGDVAIGAVVGAGNCLDRNERSDGAEAAQRGSRSHHTA